MDALALVAGVERSRCALAGLPGTRRKLCHCIHGTHRIASQVAPQRGQETSASVRLGSLLVHRRRPIAPKRELM